MKQKRGINVILLVLLMLLMAYPLMESKIHEILGMTTLLFTIIHMAFNRKWLLSITKGKYSTIRKVFLLINILLIMNMILAFISGVAMAELLPDFHFISAHLARKIHMVSVHWNFILLALHLGMHLQTILLPLCKIIKKQAKIIQIIMNRVIPYFVIVLGLFYFIEKQIISYLFMLTSFMYFNEDISIIQYLFEYFMIFISFASLMFLGLNNILNNRKRGQ